MLSLSLFALVSILSASSALAVTESASEGSKSACEAELVQDLFYRLVDKAVKDQLLPSADLAKLSEATTAYNPLDHLPKMNPALLKALDAQVKAMSPERWAGLRPDLAALATRVSGQNSARADSREETSALLGIDRAIDIRFPIEGRTWFEQDSQAMLVVSTLGIRKVQDHSDLGLKVAQVHYEANHDLISVNGKILAVEKSQAGRHLIDLDSGQRIRSLEKVGTIAYTPPLGWVSLSVEKSRYIDRLSHLIVRPLSGWKRFLPAHRAFLLHSTGVPLLECRISSVLSGNNYLYVTVRTETDPGARLYSQINFETFAFDGRRLFRIGEVGDPGHPDLGPVKSGDILYWKSQSNPGVLRYFEGEKELSRSLKGSIRKLLLDEDGQLAVLSEGASDLFVTRRDAKGVWSEDRFQSPAKARPNAIGMVRYRDRSAILLLDEIYRILYLVELQTGRQLLQMPWPYTKNQVLSLKKGQAFIIGKDHSRRDAEHVFILRGLDRSP